MLHPLYWRCPARRSVLVDEVAVGGSEVVRVSVMGGQGLHASHGPGCCFTFDGHTGEFLSAQRSDWAGY